MMLISDLYTYASVYADRTNMTNTPVECVGMLNSNAIYWKHAVTRTKKQE
jgi:hypothetical protein